jgi:hypothetical protein
VNGSAIFVAPIPPRGWRKVLWKVVNAWRWWRFKRSRRWQIVGVVTKDDQ